MLVSVWFGAGAVTVHATNNAMAKLERLGEACTTAHGYDWRDPGEPDASGLTGDDVHESRPTRGS